ncbi:alkaline phosphatase family protein [Rubrimonas cliftonensis]|uniref:Arylsulfatase A n=1 Tax=Rubrimonas cliftonensis TaxID=89524 RepID=A0A1H3W407_9RHOB|nr:alkaline phosphatase family protein [Rubrimonas cliftonensis]SDZ81845.1 Arylsulfatase A [Rubrimonas cliftonensis]
MPRKVLLITADQWRGDALGFLGHPAARTPTLDALAADGVAFTRHFTPSAPCGPARATLLTGLYPFIHRSVRNGAPLDARHANLALEARRAGLDPVLFGYTDSSADPRAMAPEDPRLRSFEGVLPGFRLEASLNESQLTGWLTELAKKGYELPEAPFRIYAQAGSPPVMARFSRGPAIYAAEDGDTAYIADRFLDFIRLRRREDWFAHVVFLRPHPPMIAPAPYNDAVSVADLPPVRRMSSREEEAGSHPFLAEWLNEQAHPDYFESQVDVHAVPEEDRAAMRAVYFGLIAEVDAQLGRIVARLKASGEWDETLVIFTADHGEMLGDHWCWGKGGWFDPAFHIPLIVRDPEAPRGARGRRVGALTESVDILPTVLGWIGREAPRDASGASLAPWLRGETPPRWRAAATWEFDFRNPATRRYERALGIGPEECVLGVWREARWKYVHFPSLPPRLYDLEADPGELRDLASAPEMAGVVARCAGRLLSHRMLHAERSFADALLTERGVVCGAEPRATPEGLYAAP